MAARDKNSGNSNRKLGEADGSRAGRGAKEATITVSLRLPKRMLAEIDRLVKARPFRTPRHLWLLEAIHEKIARERQSAAGD
jgi:hypothetical protein